MCFKAIGFFIFLIKLKQYNISPVIPKRKNAKQSDLESDHNLYKLRYLVENRFAKLKYFRSIATRCEKLARNYKYMLYLARTMIHCKLNSRYALGSITCSLCKRIVNPQ